MVADVSAIAGVHGGSVRPYDMVLAFLLFWSASLRFCYWWRFCYYQRLWQFCLSLRVLAFLLLLVALLEVLLLPESLLLPAPLAVLFVFAGAGIHVIVGRTAGGVAVAGVSAIAYFCGGSICPCRCWHSCSCWSHCWRFCYFQRLC